MKGRFDPITYFLTVRRHSFWALIAMAAGFILFAALSYVVLDTQVTVSSSITLMNNQMTDGSLDEQAKKDEMTEMVARDSVALLESEPFVKQVLDAAELRLSAATVARGVHVTRIDGSRSLRIAVTYKGGVTAAEIANEMARVACDEIQRRYTTPPITATVLDRAMAPASSARLIAAVQKGFIGAVLGLLIFLLIEFILHIKDGTIRNLEAFCKAQGAALLGRIPEGEKAPRLHGAIGGARESLRALKAVLKANEEEGMCLLVCSAGARHSFGAVASGLAAAFSESGDRTLLIDTNMHEAHMRSRLRVHAAHGLEEVLREKVKPSEAIASAAPQIDVLCASASAVENPSALLDSPAMQALIQVMRKNYAVVIVDACDANRYADAATLMRLCDRSLLVIHMAKTRLDEASDAIGLLQSAGGKTPGIVAIGVVTRYKPGAEY